MTTPSFDIAFDVGNTLGESPLWDHRTDHLVWVDIHAGQLWAAASGGSPQILLELDAEMAAVALAPEMSYLLGVDRDLVHFDPATATVGPPVRLVDEGMRCNDGAVDSEGRL